MYSDHTDLYACLASSYTFIVKAFQTDLPLRLPLNFHFVVLFAIRFWNVVGWLTTVYFFVGVWLNVVVTDLNSVKENNSLSFYTCNIVYFLLG